MAKSIKIYLELFLTFSKISAFTFGGGYAMISLLKSEVIENKKWINEKELTDIITIAQLVPGLIYISTAANIGFKVAGVIGAFIASIAVLIPSFTSIMILAYFIKDHFEKEIVKSILTGIIAGVAAMTGVVTFDLIKKSVNGYITFVIFVISYILLDFLDLKAFYIIITGLLIGVCYSLLIHKKEKINA